MTDENIIKAIYSGEYDKMKIKDFREMYQKRKVTDKHEDKMKPEITRTSILSMQVCVPKDWDDEKVRQFAESENPSGTSRGWQIRKEGDKMLLGAPERAACAERNGFVHIMLDA